MEQVRRKFDRILPWDLGADFGSNSISVDQFPKCLDLDNLGMKQNASCLLKYLSR